MARRKPVWTRADAGASRVARWVGAWVVVGTLACGGRSARPDGNARSLPGSAAGWIAGETATWRLYVAGLDVGEVRAAVGEPGLAASGHDELTVAAEVVGSGAIAMVAEVDVAGDTTLALATGLPRQVTGHVVFGRRRAEAEIVFGRTSARGQWKVAGGPTELVHVDITPTELHNVVSALGALRVWDGAADERRVLWILGMTRAWRGEFTWRGGERLGSVLGNQPAVRLDMLLTSDGAEPITGAIWISADRDRVPLRIVGDAGWLAAEFELSGYAAPTS